MRPTSVARPRGPSALISRVVAPPSSPAFTSDAEHPPSAALLRNGPPDVRGDRHSPSMERASVGKPESRMASIRRAAFSRPTQMSTSLVARARTFGVGMRTFGVGVRTLGVRVRTFDVRTRLSRVAVRLLDVRTRLGDVDARFVGVRHRMRPARARMPVRGWRTRGAGTRTRVVRARMRVLRTRACSLCVANSVHAASRLQQLSGRASSMGRVRRQLRSLWIFPVAEESGVGFARCAAATPSTRPGSRANHGCQNHEGRSDGSWAAGQSFVCHRLAPAK
jgi:hypothetical protein